MRENRVWRALIGVDKGVVVEDVELDEEENVLTVHVRVSRRRRARCGVCGSRAPGYDSGDGRRRWRALDLGTVRTFVEAAAPRVACPKHGVVVAQVPWARHGAGHTLAFDDQIAWLVVRCSKSAVAQLMRIAWRTVGAIITRVAADALEGVDRFAELRSCDEII